MKPIFYYKGQWWTGDPLTKLSKRAPVDPQPEKPPLRPGYWVEFSDPAFKSLQTDFDTAVGKINHVVWGDAGYTYVVHALWSRFDVSPESVAHRLVKHEL